jgi:hypothetical protein
MGEYLAERQGSFQASQQLGRLLGTGQGFLDPLAVVHRSASLPVTSSLRSNLLDRFCQANDEPSRRSGFLDQLLRGCQVPD